MTDFLYLVLHLACRVTSYYGLFSSVLVSVLRTSTNVLSKSKSKNYVTWIPNLTKLFLSVRHHTTSRKRGIASRSTNSSDHHWRIRQASHSPYRRATHADHRTDKTRTRRCSFSQRSLYNSQQSGQHRNRTRYRTTHRKSTHIQ